MHGAKIKWFLLLDNLTAGAEEFIKSKNKSYMYNLSQINFTKTLLLNITIEKLRSEKRQPY